MLNLNKYGLHHVRGGHDAARVQELTGFVSGGSDASFPAQKSFIEAPMKHPLASLIMFDSRVHFCASEAHPLSPLASGPASLP